VRAEALFALLQQHLHVRFVAEAPSDAVPDAPVLSDAARRTSIARRLSEAVSIGSVTDLEILARDLDEGPPAEAAIGQRVARLVADFDFTGLRELAEMLTRDSLRRTDA
jgi:hypothetical protein